jgi:hypothetical protein
MASTSKAPNGSRGLLALPLFAVATACGGSLRTSEHQDADDGGSNASPSVEGGTTAPDVVKSDATEIATTEAAPDRNPYIPRGPVVPYDKTFRGGAFDSPGGGWDYCSTRTAGSIISTKELPPSQGTRFARFTSSECINECSPDYPSDAQLYLSPLPSGAAAPSGFYVDMIDLRPEGSTGVLRFYSVDDQCLSTVLLAEVTLQALALLPDWGVRCVPLPPVTQVALGLAIAGGPYDVGLDAARFGPPCE